MPLAGRAFETLLAGNTGFSAGSSGRGRGSSGAERRAARADYAGDPAARTNRDETANTRAAAGFPGTRNCETGCKAVDDGTDSSNCLVQRQRIARTLAVRCVGDVYDSAAPQTGDFSASAAETNIYVSGAVKSPCLAGLIPAVYLTEDVLRNDTTELIVRHELTHLHHLDFLWSLCRTIAVIVYWWNPSHLAGCDLFQARRRACVR